MSAAPLKLVFNVPFIPLEDLLPRFYERGPIEASGDLSHVERWKSFRASMSAAPLKRCPAGYTRCAVGPLPRFYERGPIEAT